MRIKQAENNIPASSCKNVYVICNTRNSGASSYTVCGMLVYHSFLKMLVYEIPSLLSFCVYVFASDYFKRLISSLVFYTLFIVICINFLSGGVSSYRIVKSLSALWCSPCEYIVAATAAYQLQDIKTTGAAGSCITLNSNPPDSFIAPEGFLSSKNSQLLWPNAIMHAAAVCYCWRHWLLLDSWSPSIGNQFIPNLLDLSKRMF